MSRKQISEVRRRLNNKLSQLSQDARRRGRLITEHSNDPIEQIQSRIDLDMTVQAIDGEWKTLKAVEKAIGLLEQGEYGICQECGDAISPKRLDAIPWTSLCLRCQQANDVDWGQTDPALYGAVGQRGLLA